MKQVKQTIRREERNPASNTTAANRRFTTSTISAACCPHRPPFLLVDRIFYIDDTMVAGIKNVTMNEPFFVGHFPEEPVMPGSADRRSHGAVLRNAGIAQYSGSEHYSTYFMKIDGVKFKRKVVPGDTLHFRSSNCWSPSDEA